MKILIAGLMLAAGLAAEAAAPDLASLPDYRPERKVAGVIRSRGDAEMAPLLKQWQRGFRKHHPEVRFEDTLKGTDSAIYGLEMRTADIAVMGRAMHPYERYGSYERAWVFPVEIEVATGSFEAPGKSPAYAIFVHKDNPLAKLTVKQLDGIFGAQRQGGWKALSWDVNAARSSAENIRTWGELGVQGLLAGKPIHVYGPALEGAGTISYFQSKVLDGGAMWNEDLREYADLARMIADLGKDPDGIAYAPLDYRNATVKPVALAQTSAGPYVELSRASVTDRSYPLSRPVYFAYTIDNEKTEIADPRVDLKVREFLRYVLSKQGQQDVAREGVYLPLPPAVVAEQLRKLDSREVPPEMRLVVPEKLVKVSMCIDEDPVVMRLAESLGYFRQEGLEIVPVDLSKIVKHDYLIQEPLMKRQVDAAYHWFNHTIFGARHGFPVKAVMVFNDAPGMTVLVANRVKDRIRSAADFKGRNVAQGAGYGTKSVITSYLAKKAGLPAGSYTPVALEKKGRQEAVLQGLKEGTVDVMTFEEPVTSILRGTDLVATLYDLTSRQSTARVLGAAFPAQSILMSPEFIEAHPDTAQRLVNAFVRTMRFVNTHTAEEIAAALPAGYFRDKDRQAQVRLIRDTLPAYARGDYSFSPAAVQLVVDTMLASRFDASEEGQWRATGDNSKVRARELYTNRFVDRAMKEIK